MPRRGQIWTVRRFTDSSDLWKDTLDTLTACGVPVDRLLTGATAFLFVRIGEHHFLKGFIFLSNPGSPAQILRGRGWRCTVVASRGLACKWGIADW